MISFAGRRGWVPWALFFPVFLSWAGALSAWGVEPRLSDTSVDDELGTPVASPTPTDLPSALETFEFSQDLWNTAREEVEAETRPAPAAVLPPVLPEGAPGLGINVNLPYESGLSISGRKLIAFTMEQTRRQSAKRAEELGVPQMQNDMEMTQELQVRIRGKVGRKITVNVDFDDTKDDKRDISVMYQGDPGEFVQEAAFGDITLSLPSTEFVSYSKQLFGVRTKLQYKDFSLLAIGSRTKGTTETKRFNGATKFERRVIRDVDFVKKQYYSVNFTDRPITPGSEEVWRDNKDIADAEEALAVDKTVEDATLPTPSYTGRFNRLKPGDDYIMDYTRGVIYFKRQTLDNWVIALDYAFADTAGGKLSDLRTPGLLKTVLTSPTDPPLTGDSRELKTFYALGNIKIVRDNGRGNFILRTIDVNQNDILVQMSTSTTSGTPSGQVLDYPDTLTVDFDLGVFNIILSSAVADPQLYQTNPTSKFSFLTEYHYRIKTFQLRPNIVFNSERVTVNGRLLKNDVDYFIDYDIGLLSLFNEDDLDETTQIEVTYDYAPFGGQLGQTLVGARAELALIPGRLQAGSSFLYTFAPKTSVVPDIRNAPSSLMVLEVDGRLTDMTVPLTSLKLTLSGEAAQSQENPNLYGKALVDSMEGIAQEDVTVMSKDLWRWTSIPAPGYGVATDTGSLTIDQTLPKLNTVVGDDVDVGDSETLQVLALGYSLEKKPGTVSDPEEVSAIQSLSKIGRDFSQKNYLEVWLQGAGVSDGAGVDFIVDAGSLNEDSDLDADPISPKPDTEDVNPDGTLNEGEDIGYAYDYEFGTKTVRVGADNGRLDTEDLDEDGVLRVVDRPVRAAPLLRLSDVALVSGATVVDRDGVSKKGIVNDLGFDGWLFIRVPLAISEAELDAFRAVKNVRVTLRQNTGGALQEGLVGVGKIAFVGNTWEDPTVFNGAAMSVAAVNNLDNPDYDSLVGNPVYNDLYGDQADTRTREQALELSFNLPVGSSATTRSVYGAVRDFSQHRDLNFFYQVPAVAPALNETLFIQLGSETDYYQVSYRVGGPVGAWVLETIHLLDQNDDGTPDALGTETVGSSVTVVGAPSLARVGQIKIGVRNDFGTTIDGKIWVNEIFVSNVRKKVGNARRFAADGNWGAWGNFGGTFRSVDRNFQTLTSPIVNQDRDETLAYGNLTKFRFMPLSVTYSKSLTVTPAALQTGQSQLVSLLSEGREESIRARGDGQFLFQAFPAIAYSAERQINESTDRQERRDRNLYAGTLDYTLPVHPDLLPGQKFTFKPLPDNIFVKYGRTNYFLSYFPEKKESQVAASTDTATIENAIFSNARTNEYTDEWQGRLGFTPWAGLSLTPTYSQRKVVEERIFSEEELAATPGFAAAESYDKSFNQTHGLAASWRILRWLEPRVNYEIGGTETNGLPTASSPTASAWKTLDRTATGDAFLNLSPRDIFPKFGLLRTLTLDGSFRVESQDTYANVPKDFDDWQKIHPFRLGKVQRKDGSTMFGLLDPLDFGEEDVQRKQLTARNTLRVAGNWTPLDWLKTRPWLDPAKTLNISNTFTNTNEHTENTDTIRDVHSVSWLDMIASIRDIEKTFGVKRWVGGSQMNLRINRKETEIFFEEMSKSRTRAGDLRFSLFNRYDWFLSLSRTDADTKDLRTGQSKSETRNLNDSLQVGTKLGSWRLTPSAAYRSDVSKDATGKLLQDLQAQTYSVLGRFDKAYPGGFRFPFTKRVWSNVNRLIVDAKLGLDVRRSTLNFERDNTDTYFGEATGEWEISRNFRFSFGGKATWVDNKGLPEDSLMTLAINSQLVIQF